MTKHCDRFDVVGSYSEQAMLGKQLDSEIISPGNFESIDCFIAFGILLGVFCVSLEYYNDEINYILHIR